MTTTEAGGEALSPARETTEAAEVSGDVPATVAKARAAQEAWAETPMDERIKALLAVKDRVLDRAEDIAKKLHEEIGRPEIEVLLGEVLPSGDVVQYWC